MKNHEFDGSKIFVNTKNIRSYNGLELEDLVWDNLITDLWWKPNQKAHKNRGRRHRIFATRSADMLYYGYYPIMKYALNIEDDGEFLVEINFQKNKVKILEKMQKFPNSQKSQKCRFLNRRF